MPRRIQIAPPPPLFPHDAKPPAANMSGRKRGERREARGRGSGFFRTYTLCAMCNLSFQDPESEPPALSIWTSCRLLSHDCSPGFGIFCKKSYRTRIGVGIHSRHRTSIDYSNSLAHGLPYKPWHRRNQALVSLEKMSGSSTVPRPRFAHFSQNNPSSCP